MFKKDIKEMIDNEFDQLTDQRKDQKIADGITLISFPIVIMMKRSDSLDDYCALDIKIFINRKLIFSNHSIYKKIAIISTDKTIVIYSSKIKAEKKARSTNHPTNRW